MQKNSVLLKEVLTHESWSVRGASIDNTAKH
jgi:hypothetical protein